MQWTLTISGKGNSSCSTEIKIKFRVNSIFDFCIKHSNDSFWIRDAI